MNSYGRINKTAALFRSVIFAANDGVITTFAVVAGSFGGELSDSVVLILGFANLLADGFSMAMGVYLGSKSEADYEKRMGNPHWKQDIPLAQGTVTYLSFVLSGFVPLIPYLYKFSSPLLYSAFFVAAFLLLVGMLRSFFTHKNIFMGALEMFFLGGSCAAIAFFVGRAIRGLVG